MAKMKVHELAKELGIQSKEIIGLLQDKGYEFVKVSDLIYKENYTMDVEGRQIPDAG